MGAIPLDRALPLTDQVKDICIMHLSKHCGRVCDIVGLSNEAPVYDSGEAVKADR